MQRRAWVRRYVEHKNATLGLPSAMPWAGLMVSPALPHAV
jgi:hypothetical protein